MNSIKSDAVKNPKYEGIDSISQYLADERSSRSMSDLLHSMTRGTLFPSRTPPNFSSFNASLFGGDWINAEPTNEVSVNGKPLWNVHYTAAGGQSTTFVVELSHQMGAKEFNLGSYLKEEIVKFNKSCISVRIDDQMVEPRSISDIGWVGALTQQRPAPAKPTAMQVLLRSGNAPDSVNPKYWIELKDKSIATLSATNKLEAVAEAKQFIAMNPDAPMEHLQNYYAHKLPGISW